MSEYKHTLNLPKTDFAMKANLAEREPEQLKKWDEQDIYQKMIAKRRGKESFILHDGPPYANGDIHIGHALNKILKDIVIKSKAFSGYYTPYVPGWDCHGLPIEIRIEKKYGKAGDKINQAEFREKCREYAHSQVNVQRDSFKRLGVLGDWENPYLTMDFKYEAEIVRTLGKIYANGYLTEGFKPVHWCYECQSALAEAEVEYKDKQSPAIDVGFKVANIEKLDIFGAKAQSLITPDREILLVIWTTTPWTLPSNEAVCLHPDLTYVLVAANNRLLILAEDLLPLAMKRYGFNEGQYEIVGSVSGDALKRDETHDTGLLLDHPLNERHVPVILGQHVTTDTGTGCVHTAPCHGTDDFNVGVTYQLPIETRVSDKGVFLDHVEHVGGQFVFKANKTIIELLESRGKLLAHETLEHSYPHCWRHKTPVIFRATPQWFVDMSDLKGLRQKSMQAIKNTHWVPERGEARITSMVENRPDWCISRQRTWSVPIPLFLHKETQALHPNTGDLIEHVAALIEQEGIEAWFALSPETLLGQEADAYRKVEDTLDVWFDSGVTHACVLKLRPELTFPADLYLEGSDQHRGWFNSSLMTSVAVNGIAPYKTVLTHGFTVDANGRKMSKSIGNVIAPQQIYSKLGADVLRLWVSSVDYQSEHSISDEILKRVSDTYRRIRNTVRYLLSNLFDFEPSQHLVATDDLLLLDKLAVDRASALQDKMLKAYDAFEFHQIYQMLHHFCSQDMGGFYLDIIKDRQYTCAKDSLARRSCQTAMYHILQGLLCWIAPILSFTAEEAWAFVPEQTESSVFLANWYVFPEIVTNCESGLSWELLLQTRDWVNNELEDRRNKGEIRSSLDAQVILQVDDAFYALHEKLGDELRFLLITSEATLQRLDGKSGKYHVEVQASHHTKCVRCWHKRADVGHIEKHPELCVRCVENVEGTGEVRHFV